MRKVGILTDSACDIPKELEKKHNIDIMSFAITIDDSTYLERIDFEIEEYYEKIKVCKSIPKTAHITAVQFFEQYKKYNDDGYTDVLHISINSTGSATFDASVIGENMFKEEYPNSKLKIYHVDSKTYSITYGYFVCEAAKKIENGAEINDVIKFLEDVFSRIEIVLAPYNLKFIKNSGRISAAAAFAGEIMGIKPIISLIDGVSAIKNKVRGDSAIMPALVKHVNTYKDEFANFYMIATTDKAKGKELAKLCKKEFGYEPQIIAMLGAAVVANAGPDTVAIIYLGESRR